MAANHFRTALDYVRRSPFKATAAIFVLSLTFFVSTLVSVLLYSSSQVIKYFETRPQVIAFLKDGSTDVKIVSLQKKLQVDERVREVRYVSKEEALSLYKAATAGNPLLGELVSPDIFPSSLEFSVNDLSFAESVIDEVKKEAIVDSVGFTAALGGENDLENVVDRLRTVTTYIKVGGLIFTGILSTASFMVILIVISMRIINRKEEIEILSLIGATRGFIRSPIILEALIYSLVGVFAGWAVSFIMILYSAPMIVSYFGEIPVLPRDTVNLMVLFGIILGAEVIFGFILALSGSLLAVSRVKRAR